MSKIYNIHPTKLQYQSNFHNKLQLCQSFLTLKIDNVRYLAQFLATQRTLKTYNE